MAHEVSRRFLISEAKAHAQTFLVDSVTLERVFLRVSWFSFCHYHPKSSTYSRVIWVMGREARFHTDVVSLYRNNKHKSFNKVNSFVCDLRNIARSKFLDLFQRLISNGFV